jgi:hypothetical protein
VTSDEKPNLLSFVTASGGSISFKPIAALDVKIFPLRNKPYGIWQ